MKIIECEQGSDQWLQARLGVVTASELDALITPLWKPRKIDGDGVTTYLATKVAERWRGAPLPSFGGGAMEQGSVREEEAIPWYELAYETDVRRVGFITTDDGKIGCSPDGLCDGYGIEVKCPMPHTQVRWLLAGELPEEHRAQVYGGMLVTGLPQWKFISYCRGFPPLVLTIESDPKILAAIQEAATAFLVRLDAAWATIEKYNGGPPVRHLPDPEYVF